MKRRNRILLAALVVVVIGGLAWVAWPEPPEPVYQGRTLTDWLMQYARETYVPPRSTNYVELQNESKTAVQKIGTNAFPTLVKLVSARDSPLKINIKRWIWQLKTKASLTTADNQRTANDSHILAFAGFEVLGPVGKDAVPSLVSLLESRDEDVSLTAIQSLGCIGPQAKDAVPGLIHALNDVHLRFWTVETLGKIGENAKPAVSALLGCMNDTNAFVRGEAEKALKQIDPVAAGRAGVK
jgi:HEAT repeat protein